MRARGWHSPDGLQAPLDGLRGDEACSSIVDLVGQAKAHLQPAVDVQPHNARCAQAADSGHHYCQCHSHSNFHPRAQITQNPACGCSSQYTTPADQRKLQVETSGARKYLSRP